MSKQKNHDCWLLYAQSGRCKMKRTVYARRSICCCTTAPQHYLAGWRIPETPFDVMTILVQFSTPQSTLSRRASWTKLYFSDVSYKSFLQKHILHNIVPFISRALSHLTWTGSRFHHLSLSALKGTNAETEWCREESFEPHDKSGWMKKYCTNLIKHKTGFPHVMPFSFICCKD